MKVLGPVELSTAWAGLPEALRDHIGFVALDMVFQGFLGGAAYSREDQVLQSDDDRGEALGRESEALGELYRILEDALPDLFGPEGENPAWARTSAGGGADA